MNFDWSPQELELRQELRDFVDKHMRPDWGHLDRDMPTPEQAEEAIRFCKALAEAGGGGLVPAWPAEYGGRDAPLWEQVVISEELWGAGEPRAPQYMNVNWIGPAIMYAGTEEQKELHLKQIAAGEAMWCQGFSEPEAGTDLAALQCRAERDGDVYVVNGQKIWTSYAHRADWCFLLVRTAQTEKPRDGISILLVPMDLPGIEVRDIPGISEHLVHEVFFTDVRVPVECRLGEENEGWRLIRTILANERVGAARHEHANRMLDAVVEEADDLGVPEDDRFWETLGRKAATVAATRLLNYAAVNAAEHDSPERSAVASVYRTQVGLMEHEVSDAFHDTLGPEALTARSRGDMQLKMSTTTTIAAGTLENQLNNVARSALGLPRGN